MKYDNLKSFHKHLKASYPLHLSPIYGIFCKESHELRRAIDLTLAHLLEFSKERFFLKSLDGQTLTPSSLKYELNSPFLFSQKKVIWISHIDKLKEELLDILTQSFPTLIKHSIYLVLSTFQISNNLSFYKIIEKEGVILDLNTLKPWEKEKKLIEWLQERLYAEKKIMREKACYLFMQMIKQNNALSPEEELEKLLAFVGEKKEISLEDIQKIGSFTSTENLWSLGEAILSKNAHLVLRIFETQILRGESLFALLRYLKNQFSLYHMLSLKIEAKEALENIKREFTQLKPAQIEHYLPLIQAYSSHNLKKGLIAINALETRLKEGYPEKIGIEMLLWQLTLNKIK